MSHSHRLPAAVDLLRRLPVGSESDQGADAGPARTPGRGTCQDGRRVDRRHAPETDLLNTRVRSTPVIAGT